MKRPFIYYNSNIGLTAQLRFIVLAICYCEDTNRELYLCPDYGAYGDLRLYFDFGPNVKHAVGLKPGYMVDQIDVDTAHPDYDNDNEPFFKENHDNLYKVATHPVSDDRLRTVALTIKPVIDVSPPDGLPERYDAVHIRRGDRVTTGDDGFEYIHSRQYAYATKLTDVFVMSDDIIVLDELKDCDDKIIHNIIPETCKGAVGAPSLIKPTDRDIPFTEKSVERKRNETFTFIREMYIAARSEHFVANFRSNVPVFIKWIHKNPDNCIDIDPIDCTH